MSEEVQEPAVGHEIEEISYTAVLLTQGKHRFYTLAMPSEILAETCVVEPRGENPIDGFQRMLDEKRARDIAEYIDNGLGTIPGSIVLSAQESAQLKYTRKTRTISFRKHPKAFLIIDGQHRVYGFMLAREVLRVPVVIYNGLSRAEEARLFMDINTKQRPVPSELILDIKKLAENENDFETVLREVYDEFNSDPASPLLGLLSPSDRQKGKLSRVTFNAALKSVWGAFAGSDVEYIYAVFGAYLSAFNSGLRFHGAAENLTNPTMFKALSLAFPDVAQRVFDRFGDDFTSANFEKVLAPLFSNVKKSDLIKPGASHISLRDSFRKAMSSGFTLSKKA
ncbi:DGQHR domain-containing protein [Pseudoroseomonas wenyumeiae]